MVVAERPDQARVVNAFAHNIRERVVRADEARAPYSAGTEHGSAAELGDRRTFAGLADVRAECEAATLSTSTGEPSSAVRVVVDLYRASSSAAARGSKPLTTNQTPSENSNAATGRADSPANELCWWMPPNNTAR